MKGNLIYISGGKMFRFDGRISSEIHSGMLDRYMTLLRDSAERNEWKNSGTGAQFTGTFVPGTDTETKLKNVNSRVTCVVPFENKLIYSLSIDDTSGIYTKEPDNSTEGIVFSSKNYLYRDFDIYGNRIVTAATSLGESHIGLASLGSPDVDMITEGDSFEMNPCFSRVDPDCIYYESAGLLVRERPEEAMQKQNGEPPMMSILRSMNEVQSSSASIKGPSGIYRLNLSTGDIDDILISDSICFTKPQSCENGDLYFIRRPYKAEGSGKASLGCLTDIILLPFRLIKAIFGFFNVFSMKYSGKSLDSGSAKMKNKNEKERFIDGNLINAERSLKENTDKGEKYPGIIPRSYELCKLSNDGEISVIRKGVLSYRLTPDGIYISNGSYIIKINSDGSEEKVCKADAVTFITAEE